MELSIVIPVFNDEKFIANAINSALRQKIRAYEIIIVNDGSTDKTPSIIKRFEKTYPDIVRVITTKNHGPAMARNVGIKEAKGDYIAFLDSDDLLHPDKLHLALEFSDKYNADLVVYGFIMLSLESETQYEYSSEENVFYGREKLGEELSLLYQRNMLNQVWNKLFRTELIRKNEIRFRDYMYAEDRLFVFDVLSHTSVVAVMDKCIYNYYVHSVGTLTTKYYDKKFEVVVKVYESMARLSATYTAPCKADEEIYAYMFIKSVASCIINIYAETSPLTKKEKGAEMRRILKDENVRVAVRRGGWFGVYFLVLRRVIRTESTFLNRFMAKGINYASVKFQRFFLHAKYNADEKAFLPDAHQEAICDE